MLNGIKFLTIILKCPFLNRVLSLSLLLLLLCSSSLLTYTKLSCTSDNGISLKCKGLELGLSSDRVGYGLLWGLYRLFVREHLINVPNVLCVLDYWLVWSWHQAIPQICPVYISEERMAHYV